MPKTPYIKFDLKRLRTDLKLKQTELADALNLPQSSVSSMEKGKTRIHQDTIDKLESIYNVTNIEDYYIEDEHPVYINNEGASGSNNGYKNLSISPVDIETMYKTRIEMMIEELRESNERTKRMEERYDIVTQEKSKLQERIIKLLMLCAKNGIDCESILND